VPIKVPEWTNRVYRITGDIEKPMCSYINVQEADEWRDKLHAEEQTRNPGSPVVFETRRERRTLREPE